MQKIGITVRHSLSGELKGNFFEILQTLHEAGKEVFVCKHTKKFIKNSTRFSNLSVIQNFADLDVFIFFGGDGTLLRNVNRFAPEIFSVPIFGINAGNVGFFSSITPEKISEGLAKIFAGKFSEDKRMILQGKIFSKKTEQQDTELSKSDKTQKFFALNEAVIHHSGVARIRKIFADVSDEPLTTYRADGLIIATPTGSTAYNLSAGGPIVAASMEGFILTPLAPSGFSQRPIILPAQKKISLTSDGDMQLSVDGQQYFPFTNTDTITIEKFSQPLTFLRLKDESYYTTLREKLGWG